MQDYATCVLFNRLCKQINGTNRCPTEGGRAGLWVTDPAIEYYIKGRPWRPPLPKPLPSTNHIAKGHVALSWSQKRTSGRGSKGSQGILHRGEGWTGWSWGRTIGGGRKERFCSNCFLGAMWPFFKRMLFPVRNQRVCKLFCRWVAVNTKFRLWESMCEEVIFLVCNSLRTG